MCPSPSPLAGSTPHLVPFIALALRQSLTFLINSLQMSAALRSPSSIFCILCPFPVSIIRIIYSDCKLVEISAASPQGTIAVLVGSAALLRGCAIMMINDSTEILLLQLA